MRVGERAGTRQALLSAALGAVVVLTALLWPGHALAGEPEPGLVIIRLCWQTGPPTEEPPEVDPCDQPVAGGRLEVRSARATGRYRQSAHSPWQTNWTPDRLLFAVLADEKGQVMMELPPGRYFIRPLGGNHHSLGREFFEIKPGGRHKITFPVAGNI